MKQFFIRLIKNDGSYSALLLRVITGIIFVAYGSQKLFGWFGGYGLDGTGQWMSSIGLQPGYIMALLAGSAEFFGGIFIILGLLVRPAALVLAFTMLIAIVTVHLQNGLFMANNGYAFGLALMTMSLSLVLSGAGKLSLDDIVRTKL